MAHPDDRRYAKSHEWVKLSGDIAEIGISEHAQESLGDITFVELPAVGTKLTKGSECGVIESVKAAGDLYAPVSAEVVEVNEELENKPERINEDPHSAGWLYKVKGVDTSEFESLMDAAAYEKFLESEG